MVSTFQTPLVKIIAILFSNSVKKMHHIPRSKETHPATPPTKEKKKKKEKLRTRVKEIGKNERIKREGQKLLPRQKLSSHRI
jgi:hypothetical protein